MESQDKSVAELLGAAFEVKSELLPWGLLQTRPGGCSPVGTEPLPELGSAQIMVWVYFRSKWAARRPHLNQTEFEELCQRLSSHRCPAPSVGTLGY